MNKILGTAAKGSIIVSTGVPIQSIKTSRSLKGTDGNTYRSKFPYAGMYSVGEIIATTIEGYLSHPSSVVSKEYHD